MAELVTGREAAQILGITFVRFKVAVWRGLGRDRTRLPQGREARPVQGGWSARSARYRLKDIVRMHSEYRFHTGRNFHPDYEWLGNVPRVRIQGQKPQRFPSITFLGRQTSGLKVTSKTKRKQPPHTKLISSLDIF